MSWEDIPKTFQDAITVTRYLGFHYIWIDSLCIVQDDNEDWARESAKMSSIYANAVLTIAASAAADDTYGFLHQRQHVGVQIYPYQIHQTGHVIKVRRSSLCNFGILGWFLRAELDFDLGKEEQPTDVDVSFQESEQVRQTPTYPTGRFEPEHPTSP